MNLVDAIKLIQDESKVRGMDFIELVEDIEALSYLNYTDEIVKAAEIVRSQAPHIFL